jgi:hypothetical protein
MDPAFPFRLPSELELLALAYAAARTEVLKEFRTACVLGALRLARGLTALFDLTPEDARSSDALRLTCANGHLELARWLAGHFELTARDARSRDGLILHGACDNGHLEVARWLADHFGLTVEDVRACEIPALHRAYTRGRLALALWLINRFSLMTDDVWWWGSEGIHGMRPAGRDIRIPLMHWLASRLGPTADMQTSAVDALWGACVEGRLAEARWLADRIGVLGEDAHIRYLLSGVCKNGHLGVALWMTARFGLAPADMRADSDAALRYARENGHRAVVRWLKASIGIPAGSFWIVGGGRLVADTYHSPSRGQRSHW